MPLADVRGKARTSARTQSRATIANHLASLNIGRHHGTDLPGWVDEVALYNTALTGDRVLKHFRARLLRAGRRSTLLQGEE